MKRSLYILVVFIFFIAFNCNNDNTSENEPSDSQWIDLLAKNNLDDWIVKIKGHPPGNNFNNTFRLEDGVLKVDYSEYNSEFNNAFGHVYYKEPFSSYKLRLDYRFLDDQVADGADWAYKNSGVMIHCEDPNQISLNQNFPVSIEVQLLGGDGSNERPTANLCTPGTHVEINDQLVTNHCIDSNSDTYHDDQWIRLEIEVHNDSIIKHFINGEKVMEYTKPIYGGEYASESTMALEGQPVKSGYISLQSESHPIHFKNIELLELD